MKKEQNSDFFPMTTWTCIILISFGIMTHILKSDFTSWFFFVFFCLIGIIQWSGGRGRNA